MSGHHFLAHNLSLDIQAVFQFFGNNNSHSFFFSSRFYLFTFIEGKEGRQRGRETSMCGCLSCAPNWGPAPQPMHAPSLGIKPATFQFAGQCSIH